MKIILENSMSLLPNKEASWEWEEKVEGQSSGEMCVQGGLRKTQDVHVWEHACC